MNQKIEIKKIKVNNGQELIAKAREYKNSGGEWKLRERYLEMPIKSIGKRKNKLGWGIVISNGKQTVDILSSESNLDYKDFVEKDLMSFDEINVRPELWQLFPEVKFAHPNNGNEKLNNTSFKELKKDNEDYALRRYLVAKNSWNLKQILHEYVRKNETKINQSANPHFSGWVEIIDGQDGNVYLYVGEKNDNGGREIKIGIRKEEFYSKTEHNFYAKNDGNDRYSAEEMLELAWNLFTICRPRTSDEEREYYSKNGGLEEEWQSNWPRRTGLCRKYLEELRERMNQKFNYWQAKAKQKKYWDHEANEQGNLAHAHMSEIDYYLVDMKKNRPNYYAACDKDCSVCGVKLCCHFEGEVCSGGKSWTRADENLHHFYGGMPEPERNKNNQISPTDKNQLLQYFLTYHITKITLDNGKIVVEYDNNSPQGQKEVDNSELEKYKGIIQKLPNHSLSLSDLQEQNDSNSQNSTKNPDNKLYIGLALGAGAVALAGTVVYFWNRKKKRA